ncbi:hypothetical protein Clacol_008231 [Clathrus columnatus]|uniref:Membrane insertase YidC/Oxa/ALB C-terminal domain-containing protein n=1 Tax=Clathrus columnatus TaxID=1419009 RepID=A0AAV5AMN3_9AGAM|nr:hypothetical protein Clacol_008231 [Clathrus columnatus]
MASVSRRFITSGLTSWPYKTSQSSYVVVKFPLNLSRPQPRNYWWSSNSSTTISQPLSSTKILPDTPVLDITTAPHLELGSLKSLGLASSFTPVGWIQSLMEAINVSTGFPWYFTIISTTTLIRLVGLRFTLRSTRASANMIPIRAEYEGLMNDLKVAAQSGDSMKRNVIATQIRKMQKEHGISPWNIMQGPLIQVVSSIAGFIAIKRLCDLPLEQMKTESFAWIPSLTAADPTYLLPVLSVVAMNVQMRLGRLDALASGSKAALHFGNVFPILSVASLAVLSFLPSGVLLHLLTNITLISIQSAILRTPAIRAKLKFPPLPKSKPGELPTYKETLAVIKNWFVENRRQALETAERRVKEKQVIFPVKAGSNVLGKGNTPTGRRRS